MSYHELNLEERIAIRVGLVQKLSLREIARQLKRSPSTISREVRRNSDADGNYTAYGAYQHTKARRMVCRPKRKLEPGNELFLMVKEMLRDHFSPQQIAGNLRRMFPKLKDAYVSHETIYSKFGLRKMILNNTCKMPDRMASLLITVDAPAFK